MYETAVSSGIINGIMTLMFNAVLYRFYTTQTIELRVTHLWRPDSGMVGGVVD